MASFIASPVPSEEIQALTEDIPVPRAAGEAYETSA